LIILKKGKYCEKINEKMKPVAGLCPGFYQRNELAHLCGGGRY
jgi:hypothetical protein